MSSSGQLLGSCHQHLEKEESKIFIQNTNFLVKVEGFKVINIFFTITKRVFSIHTYLLLAVLAPLLLGVRLVVVLAEHGHALLPLLPPPQHLLVAGVLVLVLPPDQGQSHITICSISLISC